VPTRSLVSKSIKRQQKNNCGNFPQSGLTITIFSHVFPAPSCGWCWPKSSSSPSHITCIPWMFVPCSSSSSPPSYSNTAEPLFLPLAFWVMPAITQASAGLLQNQRPSKEPLRRTDDVWLICTLKASCTRCQQNIPVSIIQNPSARSSFLLFSSICCCSKPPKLWL
jgi:hypothetical protein